MASLETAYKKLLEMNKDIVILGTVDAIMNWDMETMMPPRAVQLRSEKLALLSQIRHKMSTNPQIGKLLKIISNNIDFDALDEVQKRNVELIQKNYEEQTQLPTRLVKEIAKQQAITFNNWKKAKTGKDFSIFKPELEKLIALNKQAAEILAKVKKTKTAYDALIDIYEPKMTSEEIGKIFDELRKGTEKILHQIQTGTTKPDKSILRKEVPLEKQRQIVKILVQKLGYDVVSPDSGGRIDETEHPFTTGYYDDVRITTHYYVINYASSIFSVLHETGHALYEMNLPQEWKYTPVGSPCSLGFHESQSRLYENIIGRSTEFWRSTLPKIRGSARPYLDNLELENFVSAINTVKPSKIRIEADEVTYNLHIIIRFQIESALFANKLDVSDLPEVWNQEYKEALGLKIENDSEGVMQDTHWASGFYGYFPTYALGNIYSGQILGAIQKWNANWQNELSEGNLDPVRSWLKNNIYCHGNLYEPRVLVEKATGTQLNVKPYLEYLENKYRNLYNF